jgi:hypothetical protein
MPEEMDRFELTGAGYLALLPTATLPNPVGTITRLPLSPALQALSDELFGKEGSL